MTWATTGATALTKQAPLSRRHSAATIPVPCSPFWPSLVLMVATLARLECTPPPS